MILSFFFLVSKVFSGGCVYPITMIHIYSTHYVAHYCRIIVGKDVSGCEASTCHCVVRSRVGGLGGRSRAQSSL